jgi:hypothetical protein
VEPLELDTAIEELETRVERLRSLYEQYFMGIEKIPPAVVQKDVERRIYMLRREQIRNTAKRFKLQTTIQRYNTFQQYWQRITREIENGTYRRHVLRAERSTLAAKESKVTEALVGELVASEAPPDSENAGSLRARRSVSSHSPKHSLPANPRHSTLPPPEKIEAFTRALERDLAAALDGDLDFGRLSLGAVDDSLELDEPPAKNHAPKIAAQRTPEARQQKNRPVPAATRSDALPAGHLRLPAQSAVGGHRLPPPPPKPIATADKGHLQPLPKQQAAAPPGSSPLTPAKLSPDRILQLHRDLLQAKASTADPSSVSLDALTRRLESTASQLREKHAGKRIDFAVVIKDGKAVVKPIVR